MSNFKINSYIIFIITAFALQSCKYDVDFRNVVYTNDFDAQDLVYAEPKNTTLIDDETTISIPINEHQLQISVNDADQNKVRQLETWWDSLPHPLQSQIKSNQIDIEVVSSIRTADQNKINPTVTDSLVETTGEALEQIIGAQTDMKYMVSTTILEPLFNASLPDDELATNIRLVKKVPVKLNRFNAEFYLRNNEISNDNIRSLQYWWSNLPEDIQNKIKRQELNVDMTCQTILPPNQEQNTTLANTVALEYIDIMSDVFNRMVGVYKVNNRELPVANITTATGFETMNASHINLPANQYISISLRKNKILDKQPI